MQFMGYNDLLVAIDMGKVDMVYLDASKYTCSDRSFNLQPIAISRTSARIGIERHALDHFYGAMVVRNDSSITRVKGACCVVMQSDRSTCASLSSDIHLKVTIKLQCVEGYPVRRCDIARESVDMAPHQSSKGHIRMYTVTCSWSSIVTSQNDHTSVHTTVYCARVIE